MKKTTFFIVVLLALMGVQANAITFRENLLFSSKLGGNQMVPSVTTNAKGIGSFMLNKKRDSISINISTIGLTPTFVGIYQGKSGENGTLLFDLTSAISGQNIAALLKGTNVANNLATLMTDNLYLVIGTAAHPQGELRGQIELQADWSFASTLTGSEAVPVVTTTAYGLGSFGLTLDKRKLNFKIICQNLSGTITGAKLHIGIQGSVGAVTEDLSTFISGNVIKGSIAPSAITLSSLLAGEIYLNITTDANPSGELRSQLRLQKGLAFEADAEGQQMTPAVATPAQAIGVFRLSPKLDTLYYDIVVDNVSTPIEYAHMHVGNAGLPYGALQLDFTANISGNHIKGFLKGSTLNSIAINRLLVRNLTLIVHTAAHPMGEIRGEVVRYAHEGYSVNLTGSQVVPAVATDAYGYGIVSINRTRDLAQYHWVAGNLSGTATSAQLRNNIVGQNGDMIHDLMPSTETAGTTASAAGFWTSTDANPFSLATANLIDANKTYIEIGTTNNPNGEIRGQILRGIRFYNTSATDDLFEGRMIELGVNPNPTQGNIKVQIENIHTDYLQLRVVDIMGKTIYSTVSDQISGTFNADIDLSNLANGIYFLNITDGKSTATRRLIKS
jgi:CHRD domain/Secretion system C-terminal sorting domain